MMCRQEQGRRYLAGFVIAAAFAYFTATSVISIMAWRYSYPSWLAANWFGLAFVPSAAALALGIRAWSADSVGRSVVALIVLLAALVLWQLFVVSF